MILESGSKVLIAHRRLFETDTARFFVGTVDGYDSGIARITGHSWVRDVFSGTFIKKSDLRTKIIPFTSGALMAYELPSDLDIKKVRFEQSESRTWLTDGGGFKMDLSESEHVIAKPAAKR